MTAGNPVITGWSAVSPFGAATGDFAEGVRTGRAIDGGPAFLVPDYDPKTLVRGRVGRSADRATVFALATVGRLAEPETEPSGRVGLVLGTTAGSMRSTMSITRDSLLGGKPIHVDTKVLPAAVMNYAAAQCAIRYGLTGPNTTIAGGPGAGLFALAYANRLLAAGRADRVLAGAVEECSAERAWLHQGGPLGEGGVVFSVETGPATGPAEIAALHSRVVLGSGEQAVTEALRATVSTLLAQAGAAPEQVWAVVPATGSAPERAVAAELFGAEVLGRAPGVRFGDTGAAAAAFAVAAALCQPGPADRLVLVPSGDPAGSAAGILLRVKGNR